MTTTTLAQGGATPLLGVPTFGRNRVHRDPATTGSAIDDTTTSEAAVGVDVDGDPAWAPLLEVSHLVPSTEIWLNAARVITTNYDALIDDTCDAFRFNSDLTFRAASRLVHGTYGNEFLRPLSGSECSMLFISGAVDFDAVASTHIGEQATPPDTSTPGAVETVRHLAQCLDVSETVIYRAAGIKGRTFKHWKKKPGTVPRPDSLGTLWSLASAVEDLAEYLVDEAPARWLRARPERLAALKEGRFRQYVDENLGLLTVSRESTAHRDALFLTEEAQSLSGSGDGRPEERAVVEAAREWGLVLAEMGEGGMDSRVLDDESPAKVVRD
jgi:hypothetical protein